MSNTQEKIEIEFRVTHSPYEARCAGWTKNHYKVEAFVAAKWRTMGYWTLKQLEGRVWELEVKMRLQTNAKIPRDRIVLKKTF